MKTYILTLCCRIVKVQKQAKEPSSSPDEQGDDGDIKVHYNYREIFQPSHNLCK